MSTSGIQPSSDRINTDQTAQLERRRYGRAKRIWSWILVFLFDLSIIGCFAIWLYGGVPYEGHLYLSHGADPRRAGILVAFLGYWLMPFLRPKSFVLKVASGIAYLLSYSTFRWYLLAMTVMGAALLAINQTLALRFTLYDVGIFHQILWSLNHGFDFASSISGAGNFLLDHYSPSLLILSPLFDFFKESPFFLPLVQVVLIYGGGAAWIYLAARIPGVERKFRNQLAGAVTLFVIGFDSFWGNLRWGFHENAIGFFSLSWAFAFLISDRFMLHKAVRVIRNLLVVILLFVAATSKEILLLDVSLFLICWGIYLYSNKELKFYWRSSFLFVFLVSSVICVWSFYQYEVMPHPADKNYFDRYYSYLGHNLPDVIDTLVRAPHVIFEGVGKTELAKYFWGVFSPWIFLPLIWPIFLFIQRKQTTKELAWASVTPWWIVLVPSCLSAALATYSPLRNPNFHYVLELWPVLAVMTILSLCLMRSSRLIWTWAILAVCLNDHDPFRDYRDYSKDAIDTTVVRNEMKKIPIDSAVVADDLAGPWLAARRWVTRWPETQMLPNECPEYILVRFSNEGTLTEIGVKNVISRCQNSSKEPRFNADLLRIVPLWQNGIWFIYHLERKEISLIQATPTPQKTVLKVHEKDKNKNVKPKPKPKQLKSKPIQSKPIKAKKSGDDK